MTDWQTIKPWLGTLFRLVLGVVWGWAALSKLHHPRAFTQTVRAFDATPEWLSAAIGYGAPVLMVALAILLILGVATRMAAITSVALLAVFLIGLIQAAARSLKVDPGLFHLGGPSASTPSYFLDAVLVIVLALLAVYLSVWSMTMISVEQYLGRHDVVEVPSAKRMRTEQGRRKYESQLAAVESAARTRTVYLNGSLALVVVLIVVIGIGVQSGRSAIKGTLATTNASVTHGVTYGKKADAKIDIYEDFGCAACATFERSVATQLDKDVVANLAQVRFHPIAVLDRNSPTRYSTLAANAALCAADLSVDDFVTYHNYLFSAAIQPASGKAGPTDNELAGYAKTLKFSSADVTQLTTCVQDHTHVRLVEAITELANKDGYFDQPTVLVNGKKLSHPTLATLTAAIKAADAAGPAPSPSPTASPTPTTSASGSGSSTAKATTTPSTTPSATATASKTPTPSATS